MGYLEKRIQYVLLMLMVCMLAISPAAAVETPDAGSMSLTESITSDMIDAAAAPEATVAPTEDPDELSVLATEPVILFNGTVTLTGGTFECTAYNSGTAYTVQNRAPLGALQAVAERKGFPYAITDKKWDGSEVLLLDDIGEYKYVKGGSKWVCYVNGVEKDGYNGHDDGLNVIALADADEVVF